MFRRLALLAVIAAAPALAQDTTPDYGISTFPGGELKYQPGFTHLDYVNPVAPKGGEISVWAFGSFDSMNPYTPKGRAAGLSSAPYESLLVGTADEIGTSYCLICNSMDYPEDRSEVTFTLRDDVFFSSGEKLTADDVVFSYETFRDKGLPSFRAVLQTQVETAEAIDPLTVRFIFKEGIPTRELPATVGGLPIFSKADFEERGIDFEESTLEPHIGSGPYVLESMDIGRSVTYRRRDDYWGADHPLNIGSNNFDSIRIEYYADYDAAFQGFKGGNYTFRNEASSKSWATGYDFPAVQDGSVITAELPDGSIATSQSFVFNLRRDKFSDPRVREAIGLMFNFEWSDATLFYGIYDRIESFWENTELKAVGLPSEAELEVLGPLVDQGLLDASILTEEAVVPPRSGDRQLDRGNLRDASRLLDEAGWAVGDDGIRRKDGRTLSVEFLNDSQTFDRVINPFVENLTRLGVEARMTRIDNAQMQERERSYDFDIITHQMPMSFVPGSGLRQYFGSQTANDSAFNLMGLADPGIDALIKAVEGAATEEALHVAISALDRALRAERFWIPQWFKPVHTVAYYNYLRYPDPLPPYALGNLSFWWADQEAFDKLKADGAF
ncbi:microcin C transport system substrate-binding protein [Jannaschia faecimaris]|uniref:Microcin C transport system substrate-binding protein n=1 Tax=Jannaschia faecimaris TaxID=1244108 RepID=A0A1H3R1Q5_9RHOB|nr:extracellular solute-binding protein [Jannaschia faecimaris]SDZ19235.1 microcin C transport system substrate-binding protein [Jannaschia faecimaris]